MKKKRMMKPSEAIAYLEGVRDGWGEWGHHHRRLVEAITIVLAEVEGQADLISRLSTIKASVVKDAQIEAVSDFATRFTMNIGTYTDKSEVNVVDVFRLIAQTAEETKGANNDR